jgi:hypothetical protein
VPGNGRLRPAFEGIIGHLAAALEELRPGRSFQDGDSRRYGPLIGRRQSLFSRAAPISTRKIQTVFYFLRRSAAKISPQPSSIAQLPAFFLFLSYQKCPACA